METITVAAAVIEYKGRYLLLKRKPEKENPGLWEFPGGKMNAGESLQKCLEREIMEELGVKAKASKLLGSSEMTQGEQRICLYGLETVIDAEPVKLHDHTEFEWVKMGDFSQYPMTEAELGLIKSIQASLVREVEVESINAWSCAKIYGIIYAIVGIFMGMFLFFSSSFIPSPLTFVQKIELATVVPFFNLFLGGVVGAGLATLYNLFASIVGGLKMRFK